MCSRSLLFFSFFCSAVFIRPKILNLLISHLTLSGKHCVAVIMLKLGQDWGWILTHPFFPQIIIIIIIIYHFQIFLCNYDPPHHHPLYQITHPPTYTLIHTFQSSHSTLEWWSDAKYLFSKWRWLPGCPPNNFHLIIFWRQRRNTAAYLPTVHSLWPWFARAGNVTLYVQCIQVGRCRRSFC